MCFEHGGHSIMVQPDSPFNEEFMTFSSSLLWNMDSFSDHFMFWIPEKKGQKGSIWHLDEILKNFNTSVWLSK